MHYIANIINPILHRSPKCKHRAFLQPMPQPLPTTKALWPQHKSCFYFLVYCQALEQTHTVNMHSLEIYDSLLHFPLRTHNSRIKQWKQTLKRHLAFQAKCIPASFPALCEKHVTNSISYPSAHTYFIHSPDEETSYI